MEVNFAEKVNVLGTDYAIYVLKPIAENGFKGKSALAAGYCDVLEKKIVIADYSEKEAWKDRSEGALFAWYKQVLRHEIVHAFLNESGLAQETKHNGPWALNEELVDWIARQGSKMAKAWEESGAL